MQCFFNFVNGTSNSMLKFGTNCQKVGPQKSKLEEHKLWSTAQPFTSLPNYFHNYRKIFGCRERKKNFEERLQIVKSRLTVSSKRKVPLKLTSRGIECLRSRSSCSNGGEAHNPWITGAFHDISSLAFVFYNVSSHPSLQSAS